MADYLGIGGKVVRGAPTVRVTSPVLARYLDDLRFAEQARDLDRFYGRIPPAPGPFDNINIPEMPDPVAAERAVGAAPRTWLENAEMARSMEPQPAPPLTDMLLDNDRRRALLANRLDRLTPEQRARSLPSVGQQYDADLAAARAAEIQHGRDVNTAAALAAAGIVGGGAMYGRMSQLSDDYARSQAENDIDLGPDLSGNPDGAMPMAMDVGEDPLMDSVTASVDAMRVPYNKIKRMRDYEGEELIRKMTQPQEIDVAGMFAEDPMMNLEPDSPADAVASAPGPGVQVGRNMDMEDLPGPQLRSIQALIRGGIPPGRAMDIITKGASMSPDEYRMVTGGRR